MMMMMMMMVVAMMITVIVKRYRYCSDNCDDCCSYECWCNNHIGQDIATLVSITRSIDKLCCAYSATDPRQSN